MPLDPLLKSQLKQVLTMEASPATVNVYGEIQVTASPVTCYCRMESLTKWKEKFDGTYERTNTLLVLDSDAPTPSYAARMWLPGTSVSTAAYAVRAGEIVQCVDENGNTDHWEVYV